MGRGEGQGTTTVLPGRHGAENRAAAMLEALPLPLETYKPAMRADVEAAIAGVAETEPNAGEPEFVHEAAEGERELPAEAPAIVGIIGFAQTGKDEVASYLERNYRGVRRFAFSDTIIAEANQFLEPFGYRVDQQNKVLPHFRRLLQAWGSGRRSENPNYWDQPVKQRLAELQAEPGTRLVLITGVRVTTDPDSGQLSMRDLEITREAGGVVWKVDRPGNPYASSGAQAHFNEAGLAQVPDEEFEAVIRNAVEGDLGAFEANIEAVAQGDTQPF